MSHTQYLPVTGGTSGSMAVAFCCPMGTGAVLLDSSPKLEFPTDSVLGAASTVLGLVEFSSIDGG